MNRIKKFIQEWREDTANHKSMLRTGKNVEALFDLIKKNQSLLSSFQEMNPYFISLEKVRDRNDEFNKEFIFKLKKNDEIFQINFHFVLHDGDDAGSFYSQSQPKIFALHNNNLAISSDLVSSFLAELGVENLVNKSIQDLHNLKETQEQNILKKIKVRP